MKIDEPKTPYVTEQEFQKICAEDEDYVAEFGEELKVQPDVQSIEVGAGSAMDMSEDELKEMKTGQNLIRIEGERAANSDDEISTPVKGMDDLSDPYNKLANQTAKKGQCESSMNVNMNVVGLGGGTGGKGLDINALAGALQQTKDADDEAAAKKKAFEEKRAKHYASEFQMAQLLKNRQQQDYDDEDEDEEMNK